MYSDLSAVRASFSSVFLIAQLIILNLISKILFLVRENREFLLGACVVVSTKDFGSFNVGSTPSALTRHFLHCIIIHGMNYFFMVLNY